jgi:RNA polymerase-binding transcription factor DksA
MTDFLTLVALLRAQREDLLADLREVESALRSVDEGRYGLCDRCGQAIDADRLSTHPTTSCCRACKHEYQRRRGILESEEVLTQT